MKQIDTTRHADALADLGTDKFLIVAVRDTDIGLGAGWRWMIPMTEVKAFRDGVRASRIITVQRQDDGMTVQLAKLARGVR